MANRKTTELDRLRAQTWARNLFLVAGVKGRKKLEEKLLERAGLQRFEASNRLDRYYKGENSVQIQRQPGGRGDWVEYGELAYPESADWFDTPVWYLLEPGPFYAEEVLACVRLLPESFRKVLLNTDVPGPSAGLVLQDLWEDRIYELAARPSVWSLGALACAFRRAEFAGQAAVFRFAAIGILWTLDRLIAPEPALLQEPLIRLRRFSADYFATLVVPLSGVFPLGISARDVERFSDSVQKFLQREAETNAEIWSIANGK
jgi:hypothetical protein